MKPNLFLKLKSGKAIIYIWGSLSGQQFTGDLASPHHMAPVKLKIKNISHHKQKKRWERVQINISPQLSNTVNELKKNL